MHKFALYGGHFVVAVAQLVVVAVALEVAAVAVRAPVAAAPVWGCLRCLSLT